MKANLRAWWQQIRKPLGIIGFIVACIAVVVLVFVEVWLYGTGFVGKTLWNWLGLLAALAIPAVVGLGAAWFTSQQGKVSDRENKDNQREAALQAYIDKISELLLNQHLGDLTADGNLKPERGQLRKIARTRTITVLTQLDARRKREQIQRIARVRTITVLTQLDPRRVGYVFAFLRETGLISCDAESIVSLKGANLNKVDFRQAVLDRVDLRGAHLRDAFLNRAHLWSANLSEAWLVGANLSGADLTGTNLSRALLVNANLSGANLHRANLSGAFLMGANLRGARLSEANLAEADLSGANLSRAWLADADLSGATITDKPMQWWQSPEWGDPGPIHRTNLSGTYLVSVKGLTFEEREKYKARGAIVN